MTVTCDACGATNPDRASWCNQCLSDLTRPAGSTRGPGVARPPAVAADHDARRVRSTQGGVEWSCEACGAWNPVEARSCATCGSQSPLVSERTRRPAGAPVGRVLVLSALLPGLGHLVAGWLGSGLARIVLFTVWALGGVLLLAGGGLAVALPLLLGAGILWGLGLPDAVRAVEGRTQLLTGRVLLWLVVGVTLLSVLGAASMVVAAR